jgi:hypothetical protein
MSRMVDRLPADDQRRLLRLVEQGLAYERRFERAAALLAHHQDELPNDWFREVAALVNPVVNGDPARAREEIERLAGEHAADPWDVRRVILRHLGDWTSLDDASRSEAITKERDDRIMEVLTVRRAVIFAKKGPFSAFDFNWDLGLVETEALLKRVAEAGYIRATGERAYDYCPVYELVTPSDSEEPEAT